MPAPAPRCFVVVDLAFGDAGKGTVTDWLVRRHAVRTIVRFNGGAQAGHNVVTPDGRHHTFAQFGSGSFVPGVATHFAAPTVFHPTALAVEARYLSRRGVSDALDRFTVSPAAKLVTPFHPCVGQLRELARGDARHGTCGVGIGEVERDALDAPGEALTAALLDTPATLRRAAQRAQERLRATVIGLRTDHPAAAPAWALLDDPGAPARWADAVAALSPGRWLRDDAHLRGALDAGPVVMEGAQGVLLDEWRGFHPHTTWSTCTFDNTLTILRDLGWRGPTTRLGVLRSYHTRHGEGPFPSEAPARRPSLPEAHNGADGWQGAFRVGDFDAVLARYALAAVGGVDGLCLTHLDRLESTWPVCNAWQAETRHDPARFVRAPNDPSYIVDVALGPARDLAWQEALTQGLLGVRTVPTALRLGDTPAARAADFIDRVEAMLGAPVWLTSHGPTADDKHPRGPL